MRLAARRLAWLLALLALPVLACNTLQPPRPAVAWDSDPANVVLRATFCCGLVPMSVVQNSLPDVQIWGDGRLIWTEQTSSEREVYTATLTPDQLAALLQQFVDAGFFGWDSNYGDYSITDGANQCLSITLTSQSHQVCEYYSGAPAKFHTLYALAAGGAGAAGTPYVPAQGYVTAYPVTPSQPPTPDQYLNWPAASLGVSAADLTGGAWLAGDALAFAWNAVNHNVWQALVRDGDDYYWLEVLVPGVTTSDPPAPPTP